MNGTPLFWVELTFKVYEDAMTFCVSFFVLCLEPTVREQLDESNFPHCYGIFWKYHSETTWSSYVLSSSATIARHFENGIWNDTLQLKILRTRITIWTNFFSWVNILKRKSAKIIIYTIIRACSSKNIARIIVCFFSLK